MLDYKQFDAVSLGTNANELCFTDVRPQVRGRSLWLYSLCQLDCWQQALCRQFARHLVFPTLVPLLQSHRGKGMRYFDATLTYYYRPTLVTQEVYLESRAAPSLCLRTTSLNSKVSDIAHESRCSGASRTTMLTSPTRREEPNHSRRWFRRLWPSERQPRSFTSYW